MIPPRDNVRVTGMKSNAALFAVIGLMLAILFNSKLFLGLAIVNAGVWAFGDQIAQWQRRYPK
jgi:hypothetical protein